MYQSLSDLYSRVILIYMFISDYIQNLKSSITSIDYYFESQKKPFKNTIIFFVISIGFIGILRGFYDSIVNLPEMKGETYAILDELYENFDPELEIIWADNQLELNRDYVDVYWPSSINSQEYDLTSTIALISNSEVPPEESELLLERDPLVYINKNSLYTSYQAETREWTGYSLADMLSGMGSYSINKQVLPKIIEGIKETVDEMFITIQVVNGFLVNILYISSRLWFLLIESILVFFLFKLNKYNFDFKKVLILSMNILVPTEIIHLLTNLLYPDLLLPIDTISYWVILIFLSLHLRKIKIKYVEKK